MTRKESLLSIVCKDEESKNKYLPLIEEVIFLEDRLDQLKKLPFIKVHPEHPEKTESHTSGKAVQGVSTAIHELYKSLVCGNRNRF